MISMNKPKMESRPYEFLLHSPLLMLLTHIMSVIHRDILHPGIWENDINLQVAAKSLQSCQTLCDPIDGSPPGSPVPGILQARILEWIAISFSNA